ncbi:hypothetical protein KY284_027192 [Solanum tuberosum]|nr:hypothetical protein KY284_027192 [Solanum tuberosum]
MDVYVTLRFHHGGKLQQKPRIKYEGVEEVVVPPPLPPVIGYLNDVGGESNTTFDKESSQTFEGSEGLGFEEAARPEKPFVGEVLGRNSASVGEDLGRVSVGVGEDLGRDSVGVGEDLDGTSSAAAASDIPEVGSDWESEIEASDDSDNADLPDEGEDEYGSDVHEEVINLRKEKRAAKRKKRKEKGPRSEGVDLDLKKKLIWDMMNIYPRNKLLLRILMKMLMRKMRLNNL